MPEHVIDEPAEGRMALSQGQVDLPKAAFAERLA
jgi:hypothetical protein